GRPALRSWVLASLPVSELHTGAGVTRRPDRVTVRETANEPARKIDSESSTSSESLADGPASPGLALAGRECVQLVRVWVDPPVRDHLPAPVPRLLDRHGRFGACRDPVSWDSRNTSLRSPARSLS